MEETIIILLIISTVLACWSFSLFLRLLSEYVARKRQRLRSEFHRKGITKALVAMGLGIIGSAVSGWFAFDIAKRTSDLTLEDDEIVTAVIFGLALFASMLLIWAIIGDRSRGRLRCPRCWYNMEGIDTPQCPECGKAIKSDRHLRKARRMKWPFGLAGLLVGFAAYGFVNLERVEETDAFALMPTWVLMMGWEVLPEDWILSENSTLGPTLERRLREEYIVGVSERRRERFLVRLANGLEGNFHDRWNSRRYELLRKYVDEISDEYWHLFTGVEWDSVLLRSAEDIYYAIEHKDKYDQDSRVRAVLEFPRSSWPFETSLQCAVLPDILAGLSADVQSEKLEEFSDEYLTRFRDKLASGSVEFCRDHLRPLRDRADPGMLLDAFVQAHHPTSSRDRDAFAESLDLIVYLNFTREAFEHMCISNSDDFDAPRFQSAVNLVFPLVRALENDEWGDFYSKAESLTTQENVYRRALGIHMFNIMNRLNFDDSQDDSHVNLRLNTINRLNDELLNDDRNCSYFEHTDAKLSLFALQIKAQANPESMTNWVTVNNYLRWAGEGPIVNWHQHNDADGVAEDWISMFRWCFEHPDPKIRAWAFDMIPVNENSCLDMRDERVLLLAQGLVDPDEDVQFEAEYTAEMFEHPTLLRLLESWEALKD